MCACVIEGLVSDVDQCVCEGEKRNTVYLIRENERNDRNV